MGEPPGQAEAETPGLAELRPGPDQPAVGHEDALAPGVGAGAIAAKVRVDGASFVRLHLNLQRLARHLLIQDREYFHVDCPPWLALAKFLQDRDHG